ncbi:ABC transporter substrate-binding protein [Deinococcus cellulosilyticus]|uniref:Sugar ABC transporter substrate-binding protein n=1 Tax=Deinococcus cellulosilyticus (strain DSM 18568 / NBRC 106333 / KACC 11606 / 5516J-15) TaxID=1223518 RepID=A0A511N1R2_DEIC1|nr:ABC transporter substrate-binding protein [Deinococcus cellulosilyticus]GEM46296.1 sugar ABC transporter substrate-binding protein [Deinococcus cellulosilyticus NBRC 106333 = KACC 11606]
MKMKSFVLGFSVLAITSSLVTAGAQELPKLAVKDKYRIGFSQTESDNPWRLAFSKSMQDEAKRLGWTLVETNAGGSAAKQVADVRSLIAQRVDAIFISPREEKPLAPVVLEAKKAGIPVIIIDRNVDDSIAKAGRDYITFIGSDFVEEGKRAAEWLVKATKQNAKIIELEGSTGSSPANDRKNGFHTYIKKFPGMQVIAAQTGNFTRDEGRKVMETLLQAHPEVTAVFAHNDEMAIGAITALEAAGRKPGKDVIIVSIDGQKEALNLILQGKLGATVECNPRFGVKAFQTLKDFAAGKKIPLKVINPDKFYDKNNAKKYLADAY